jgi:DNA-binding LytR/AlgR family response regulator
MVKIAIVEDEAVSRDTLIRYLNRYQQERDCVFEYTLYSDGAEIVTNYNAGVDIIFMDIDMPLMNGMEAARRIRKKDSTVAIVFITNVAHYAIKGYEVDALDFMVKPLYYETFAFKMNRIMNRMEKREDTIVLISNDVIYKVGVSDIRYVEVTHHTLTYYTTQWEIKVRSSMKEAEELLASHGFCRCDSCYLINLRYVTRVEENDVYLGETKLHVSRTRKKALVRALSEFISVI